MRFVKMHVWSVGGGLMLLGSITILRPDIFAALYDLGIETESARSVLRGVIGGSELGIGAFFAFGWLAGISLQSRATLGAFLFFGLLVGRLYQAIIDPPLSPLVQVETAIEAVIALGFWASIFHLKQGEANA